MKKITSFIVSVLLVSIVIYGLYFDDKFWRQASLGFVWFLSIWHLISSWVALGNGEAAEELRRIMADRPEWRKYLFRWLDLPIAVLLAGHGYWWTFGVFGTHVMFSLGAEIKADRESTVCQGHPHE